MSNVTSGANVTANVASHYVDQNEKKYSNLDLAKSILVNTAKVTAFAATIFVAVNAYLTYQGQTVGDWSRSCVDYSPIINVLRCTDIYKIDSSKMQDCLDVVMNLNNETISKCEEQLARVLSFTENMGYCVKNNPILSIYGAFIAYSEVKERVSKDMENASTEASLEKPQSKN